MLRLRDGIMTAAQMAAQKWRFNLLTKKKNGKRGSD